MGAVFPLFRVVIAITLALFLRPAFSQEGTKPRVVLYKDRMAAEFDTVDVVKNVFKFNPLLFFRGELPIYYERALSPNLSLEVGLGVTLRDYLAMSFGGDDADDFGAGTEIIPRPSYHIAARFYTTQDLEPQGWYIQPEFAHLEYVKDIREQTGDGGFTDVTLRDERVYNDLRLLFGYQMLSYSSNWLFDLYGGFAYRSRYMEKVEENFDPANLTYAYEVVTENDAVPALFLGVKVGIGF